MGETMTSENEIRAVFNDVARLVPGAKWAVCPLDFSEYRDAGYNFAVLFYYPLATLLTMENYSEQAQYELQQATFPRGRLLRETLLAAAERNEIRLHIAPVGVDHQTPPYITPLSAKEIGVKAGVGWIGRSDLLVTEEYGPRVFTLSAVFYADEFTVGTPVTTSRCGACKACVEACPFHNIYGPEWGPGVTRDDLVDYHNCSVVRWNGGKKLGHKVCCARCMECCPVGVENVRAVIDGAAAAIAKGA